MKACAKAAKWQQSLGVMEWIPVHETSICNAAMNACARGHQWAHAVQLLDNFPSSLQPDVVTFNSCIHACSLGLFATSRLSLNCLTNGLECFTWDRCTKVRRVANGKLLAVSSKLSNFRVTSRLWLSCASSRFFQHRFENDSSSFRVHGSLESRSS